jgi:alpha/beta superfamily hydrolase
MNTKAVYRSAQALSETGFHVLRFNFRGVGGSTGSFGDGAGEEEDTAAALDWIVRAHAGLPALLGGFSFGSRIALAVGIRDERVRGLLALGIPLSLDAFDFLAGVAKPLLVVQGENDEYGSGEEVQAFLQRLAGATTLVRVAGSDHYFHEHFAELQEALREYFRDGPGARTFPPR